MNVTIIGGGNIGTLMAAELAHGGYTVTVYTSKAACWQNRIEVFDAEENFIIEGSISCITADIEQAAKHADLFYVTVPAQMFSDVAQELLPYVKEGQYIGIVPGSGGAEFAFKPLLEKGCVLFGLQRVHSIARVKECGKSVYMLGRKKRLEVGSIPRGRSMEIAEMLEDMFHMESEALPNYLAVTLTPSNSILHTTRLYTMLKNYGREKVYERNYLFYEEWDDAASEMLIACDAELQTLCDRIPMDLDAVKSLCEYYESNTPHDMTAKIRGIEAFKGLLSPMERVGDKWVPDFKSRYFTTDFAYGLKVIKELCKLYAVKNENITKVWDWYREANPQDAQKAFRLHVNKEDFMNQYLL